LYETIPKHKTCCQNAFFELKNCVKNVKTRKIANIVKTARNIAKSSKLQHKTRFLDVLQGKIISFKLHRKIYFLLKIERFFKVVKMNFSSKFGVTSHNAILQS